MSTPTIVEPTGVPATMATSIPTVEQATENAAATAVTARKDFETRIAVTAENTRIAATALPVTRDA